MPVDLKPIADLNVRNLDQYFGLWAVDDERFMQMLHRVGSMDLRAHVQAQQPHAAEHADAQIERTQVAGGGASGGAVAVIDINGSLTKYGSSLSAAGSMIRLRQAVRAAAKDSEITAIVLRIDSPGGTVAGTKDLADAVAEAARSKPVHAYVEDLTASAAYWIAAQADKVFANNPTALIGSIGVFAVVYDLSEAAAKEGIEVLVFKSGKFKGAGVPGSKITEEQRAMFQTRVDQITEHFVEAVKAGRGMSEKRVRQIVADGGVYLATEAQERGLIDGVKAFDEVLAGAVRAARPPRNQSGARAANPNASTQETTTMSEPTTTKTEETKTPGTQAAAEPKQEPKTPASGGPATLAQLKAAFPNADAAFRERCLEQGMSMQQATQYWAETLEARLQAREEELAVVKATPKASGNPPVKPGKGAEAKAQASTSDAGGAEERWHAAVKAAEAKGLPRGRAIAQVCKEDPDLHAAYLAAYNARHGRRVA